MDSVGEAIGYKTEDYANRLSGGKAIRQKNPLQEERKRKSGQDRQGSGCKKINRKNGSCRMKWIKMERIRMIEKLANQLFLVE